MKDLGMILLMCVLGVVALCVVAVRKTVDWLIDWGFALVDSFKPEPPPPPLPPCPISQDPTYQLHRGKPSPQIARLVQALGGSLRAHQEADDGRSGYGGTHPRGGFDDSPSRARFHGHDG